MLTVEVGVRKMHRGAPNVVKQTDMRGSSALQAECVQRPEQGSHRFVKKGGAWWKLAQAYILSWLKTGSF